MSTCMSTSRSNYFDMSIWKKHADHSTNINIQVLGNIARVLKFITSMIFMYNYYYSNGILNICFDFDFDSYPNTTLVKITPM